MTRQPSAEGSLIEAIVRLLEGDSPTAIGAVPFQLNTERRFRLLLSERRGTVSYDLSEHRHRFAVWAAARASQRGFTTVDRLRAALEATDILRILESPATLQLDAAGF